MAFSDPSYLLFLALVVAVVSLLPAGKARLLTVIVASWLFLLLLQTNWYVLPVIGTVAYLSGLAMQKLPEGHRRRWLFICSLCVVLTPLLLFKYSFSAYASLAAYFPSLRSAPLLSSLVLPIGLSFYTFLTAGYIIDVYVENVEAEKEPFSFATMLFFFPTVTAGPIERASHFFPQLIKLGSPSYEQAVAGLRAILIGLVLKVVIADSLSPYVAYVFGKPRSFGATDLAIGNFYFAFQVYADFAGYSLIAIGSARLLGIELLPNFRQPYLSQSVGEFWRRWHITLSSWFRDYVFMPLQFKARRSGIPGLAAALVFTFVLVGIWHGAGLKYVIFGLIHGALVAYSTLTLAKRDKFWRKIGISKLLLRIGRTLTTFFIVYLTLVLFRAESITDALVYYKGLLAGFRATTLPLALPFTLVGLTIAIDLFLEAEWNVGRTVTLRWTGYYAAAIALVYFTVLHAAKGAADGQFIYFNF